MTTSTMKASRFGCGVTTRLATHFVARVQPGNRRWRQGPPQVSPGLRGSLLPGVVFCTSRRGALPLGMHHGNRVADGGDRGSGPEVRQWRMPELRPLSPVPVKDVTPRLKGQRSDPQKFAVDVAPSRIDGQGAFAAEPIPARRKIGEIRGESVSVREARRRAKGQARIMIVELSDKRAIDASRSS